MKYMKNMKMIFILQNLFFIYNTMKIGLKIKGEEIEKIKFKFIK